jgi:hypothetical protein
MKKLLWFFLFAIPVLPCGKERWSLKTLKDEDVSNVNMMPIHSTISDLNDILAPTRQQLDAKPDSRFAQELRTYSTQGYLVGFKLEADEDFHIVLSDVNLPSKTMIFEMPSQNCVSDALKNTEALLRNSWEQRFGKALPRFRRPVGRVLVEMEGYGFFDFLHGQTGVAKNGFELHPVISWREVRKPTAKPTKYGSDGYFRARFNH